MTNNIDISANADTHKRWIIENGFTANSWKSKGYKQYKNSGAVYDPATKFNMSWYQLRGLPEYKDAAWHRDIIRKNEYTVKTWQSEGYDKFKSDGAVFAPHRKFDKPWSFFSGSNTHQISKEMPNIFFDQLNYFRKNLYTVIPNKDLLNIKIESLSDSKVKFIGFELHDNVPSIQPDSIEIIGEGDYEYTVTEDGIYSFTFYPKDEKYTVLASFIDNNIIELYKDPTVKSNIDIILQSRENALQRLK